MASYLLKKSLRMTVMVALVTLLLPGCAASRSFLPTGLPNVTNYSNCTPVYQKHTPPDVAKLQSLVEMVKKNPSLLEKALPAGSIVDVVGKNAPALGTGLASTISAIKGDISVASIVGSTVMGSMSALTSARSESKEQARVGVCVENGTNLFIYKDKDVELISVKDPSEQTAESIRAYKNKENVK